MGTNSQLRTAAAYFCVIGFVLGFCYISFAWVFFKHEELNDIWSVALTIPAILFFGEANRDGVEPYENKWDAILKPVPIIALGIGLAMLVAGWLLRLIHLKWLPNVVTCVLLATASVRRAYLWCELLSADPLPTRYADRRKAKRRKLKRRERRYRR
jgi:hypothetical protein